LLLPLQPFICSCCCPFLSMNMCSFHFRIDVRMFLTFDTKITGLYGACHSKDLQKGNAFPFATTLLIHCHSMLSLLVHTCFSHLARGFLSYMNHLFHEIHLWISSSNFHFSLVTGLLAFHPLLRCFEMLSACLSKSPAGKIEPTLCTFIIDFDVAFIALFNLPLLLFGHPNLPTLLLGCCR